MTDNKLDKKMEEINEEIAEALSNEPREQYLTFFMDNEEYGVNILGVQEIRGWEEVTPIPNSPDQVKGVMNLRGTIVPVIDLRRCFGIQNLEYSEITVVIVMTVKTDSAEKVMGVVVDAVSDVHTFSASEIQPSPDSADHSQENYVVGLGSADDKMVILLELHEGIIQEMAPRTPSPRAA